MITWCCPYWHKEKQDRITCEGGTIRFPDKTGREDWIRRYCISQHGWADCPVAEMMETYYERKDEELWET